MHGWFEVLDSPASSFPVCIYLHCTRETDPQGEVMICYSSWGNACMILTISRQGQRKTQTNEVGVWNTTMIFIKQKVKRKEGCGLQGN